MNSILLENLSLNENQLEAVKNISGPLLILAGAGTGKTKTIVSRIAYLIKEKSVYHNKILAVTFTNKASEEMKIRINKIIGDDLQMHWLGTFHSIALKILRYDGDKIGINKNFIIYDDTDQIRLLTKICNDNYFECDKKDIRKISTIIQNWKNDYILPDNETLNLAHANKIVSYAKKCYTEYQSRLRNMNALDFGDLLMLCILLFKNHPEVLAKYKEKFQYIMIDEYQDTNTIQYQWCSMLVNQEQNICCVGDDDQSIYGWRGAKVNNILNFQSCFDNVKIIKLERNYRSYSNILNLAFEIINKNENRYDKKLWTSDLNNEKIKMFIFEDGKQEAYNIIKNIKYSQHNNTNLSNAILVRSGFQTRNFEESCTKLGMQYKIIGGLKFYDRKEIKDIISYLRLIINHNDDMAFERIVNTPRRGVGPNTLSEINLNAKQSQFSLLESANYLINTKQIKNTRLAKFLAQIKDWKENLSKDNTSEVVSNIIIESGYMEMLRNDSQDSSIKEDNIKELINNVLDSFDDISEFLNHISLVSDNNTTANSCKLFIMTIHSAKGLEFDNVYLPCWEENIFPNVKIMKDHSELEEERRLSYVAVTRAKKQLVISRAQSRFNAGKWQYNDESRFTKGIKDELIERIAYHTKYY